VNRLRSIFVAAALLSALPAAAGPTADPYARHTQPITDHAWLLYNNLRSTQPPFEGNVLVFEQRDGLVVVDAGGSIPSGHDGG